MGDGGDRIELLLTREQLRLTTESSLRCGIHDRLGVSTAHRGPFVRPDGGATGVAGEAGAGWLLSSRRHPRGPVSSPDAHCSVQACVTTWLATRRMPSTSVQ
jgi:hypothetical protein